MSNQSTYYEVWIEWTNVGSSESHIATAQPVIAANGWNAQTAPTNVICNTDVPGTLLTMTAVVKNTKFSSSGTTYYIDIQ
jgi:hypothetical protein